MSEKILVIEDDASTMRFIEYTLEQEGYEVITATDGLEGLRKAQDEHPDLVLLDIMLPDINGNVLYPLLMDARSDLKVIVCSGYSIDGPAQGILDAGAQEFIQKPFTIEELSEKLKKVIAG
ncbi:MAG: response regulator [Anaerolineales bacterium]|nr:response regulator [Anaerolineales bacterium]